jgi:uncharacterized protein (DUF885 family)
MRQFIHTVFFFCLLVSNITYGQPASTSKGNAQLAALADRYYEENARLNPINATVLGDNRYNDLLQIDFIESFRATAKRTYQDFLTALHKINRERLNETDQLSYDVLRWQLKMNIERLEQNSNTLMFTQNGGLPTGLVLLGSGTGSQPFKTVQDYDNWLRRAAVFSAWSDSAVVYFRKGIAQNIVLPKPLVEKMLPQLASQISTDPTKSMYYAPITKMPDTFSEVDKKRLTAAFATLITDQLTPAYQKLHNFLQTQYLPKARTTSGYGSLPGGVKMYDFAIRYFTTTGMTADQIFNLGLSEVARIQKEMQQVKTRVGYMGDLKSFFASLRTDPKYFPYKSAEEILDYYRSLNQRMAPALSRMFNRIPKTPFEVRQIEAFRAASSAAHYSPGSLTDNRPGVFYVPIIDPTKTIARESLFLHEAIPGHHYQVSLQLEDTTLPRFRRLGFGSTAYVEGWGLYAESLGKELGMYGDPYQHMMALGDEIHRAIRLVVDAGLHAKGWTREQAIQYSLDNEPIEEQRAVSEVERYMASPGQALAYKIGELKIKALRARYEKQLGTSFNLAAFHDAILMDGPLPLAVLERKMDAWAKRQKK